MGILKKSTPRKSETKVIPDEKDGTLPYRDAIITDEIGQLALDVFQTADEIVVVAPIAGVLADDLSMSITDEVLMIQGRRNVQFKIPESDYFTKECFWGNFSRSIILPESVDTSRVSASFKNGILTVRIPKVEKIRTRVVKIKEE